MCVDTRCQYKKYPKLAEDFEEEIFWFIDEEIDKLRNLECTVKEKIF